MVDTQPFAAAQHRRLNVFWTVKARKLQHRTEGHVHGQVLTFRQKYTRPGHPWSLSQVKQLQRTLRHGNAGCRRWLLVKQGSG